MRDRREYKKKWDAEHPDYQKNYMKKYRFENKDEIDAQIEAWKKSHPDKVKEYALNFRKKNSKKLNDKAKIKRRIDGDEINRKNKEYRQSSVRTFLCKKLCQIKKEKHRGKTSLKYRSDITLEYLMSLWDKQDGMCAITGKKLLYEFGSPFTVSIDRIDSNIGYFVGNVQLVCQAINFAKNSYKAEQFLHFWKYQSPELIEPEYCI